MRVVDELLPLSNVAATCADEDTALTRAFRALRSRRLSCENLLALLPSLATPATAIIADSTGATPLMAVASMGGAYSCKEKAIEVLGPISDWQAVDDRGLSVVARSVDRGSSDIAMALWAHTPTKLGLPALPPMEGPPWPISHPSATMSRCFRPSPRSPTSALSHHGCDALMLAIENADSTGPASCAEITAILAPRVDVFSCDSLGESSLEKALDRGLANVAEIIQARMAILAERDALGLAASEPASPPSRKLTRI